MQKIIKLILLICLYGVCGIANSESLEANIDQAMAADHREVKNVGRDKYRHPKQTLQFFGLKKGMTVVEIWPSSGWYTEILAPVMKGNGNYFAAAYAMTADRTPNWRKKAHKDFMEKMELRPDVYDHVVVTELSVPERTTIAPPGTVDMILTFRNVHNWMNGDYAEKMLQIFASSLKTGGSLGLVEHRANPGSSIEDMKLSGYVTEAYVIQLAEQAGFVLEARSEINANSSDSKDHPAGVWSLSPGLRYCRKMDDDDDKNRCLEKFAAIGESDRMTLLFRKK